LEAYVSVYPCVCVCVYVVHLEAAVCVKPSVLKLHSELGDLLMVEDTCDQRLLEGRGGPKQEGCGCVAEGFRL
jgi:hypothetical protein